MLSVKRVNNILNNARPDIIDIGIGYSNSLANGAPMVISLETITIIFIAVHFLLKGNILSS